MPGETALWQHLERVCAGAGVHLQRIEDKLSQGVPDVNGCWQGREFWIELKRLDAWPKRPQTVVRIPHYTNEQRLWIRRRGRAGGNALLLVQIDQDFLLYNWVYAQRVGELISTHMLSTASSRWKGKICAQELLPMATQGGPIILARAR